MGGGHKLRKNRERSFLPPVCMHLSLIGLKISEWRGADRVNFGRILCPHYLLILANSNTKLSKFTF